MLCDLLASLWIVLVKVRQGQGARGKGQGARGKGQGARGKGQGGTGQFVDRWVVLIKVFCDLFVHLERLEAAANKQK